MDQRQDNTKRRKWKQVSEKERYKIEALKEAGESIVAIGKQLGRDRRTIQRELRRGTVRQISSELVYYERYCADAGQRVSERCAANKGRPLKIGRCHGLAAYLEEKIVKQHYSPDAALGELRREDAERFEVRISTKTLYHYIDMDLFAGISNKDLPYKRRKGKTKRHKIRQVALNNRNGRSIEERDREVLERVEQGNWEMDSVVGKNNKGACLLVLTERSSRMEIIRKIESRTQSAVAKMLDELERVYGKSFSRIFKTITVDNGGEFLDSKTLEGCRRDRAKKRTTLYYAHPYSAWERGSNENQNRMIRRFIPKGSRIEQYTKQEISHIEQWLNNYPRRQFGYESAAQRCKLLWAK